VREVIDEILKAQGRWEEVLSWYDPAWFGRRRARAARPAEAHR